MGIGEKMDADLTLLYQKIDYLTEQVEAQRKSQQEFEELKRDLIPIANHMIKLSIDELAEIGTEFQLEDLLFLFKRLLRDTHLLVKMLDRLEALMGFADEAQILGKQVFCQTVEKLDDLEHQGYFNFIRGGGYILERIVTEFGEEDVHALGDNIVTILTTMRNMTQPEVLEIANNMLGAIHQDQPQSEDLSTWALLREFSDPKVRKGLGRMLNLVKVLADQPQNNHNN